LEKEKQPENRTDDLPVEIERRVMCRWWQPHKYDKWQDLSQETNLRNQPVLIQERRCMVCNSAQRQSILMN
jgi:hypothetical protein